MTKSTISHPQQEPAMAVEHKHLVCWKSSFGGLLIALMAFITLTSLGAGIAGFTAEGMVNREQGASALATGAGLYLGLSIVIALFCGSYFALRISRFVTTKVGAAHGFVIASAFFILLLMGVGNMIGGLASGFGAFAKAAGSGATDVMANPAVQDTINQSLGTSQLKSDPQVVAQGLAVRLMQGDTDSAKNYLAYQTGQTPADVDAKVSDLKTQFDAAAKTAALKTAHAVGDTGISFFVIFLVGLIGSVVGGRVGAHANVERPFAMKTTEAFAMPSLQTQRGSVVPYIFGWLLGVPVSLLILIAMFRTVF